MNLLEKVDLWSYLSSVNKPIVIYGMGNGADKILQQLHRIGKDADDFFASDGFVRGHEFHGKRVLSFREVIKKYDGFIILLSFATRLDDVLSNIYSLNENFELYAPDVPVYGDGLFDRSFYLENEDKIQSAYKLLKDEPSKQIFENIINYKLSGKIHYLKTTQNSYLDIVKSNLRCYNYYYYADGGAYNGDTVLEAAKMFPSIKQIYAFEPDIKNFKKLTANTSSLDIPISLYNASLGQFDQTVPFYVRGGRNSSIDATFNGIEQGKTLYIQSMSLDSILPSKPGLIKLDVEGAELDALMGAKGTIQNGFADLQVSLYHRNEDIFEIILYISSISDSYEYSLNRPPYIPAWDTVLYAIQKN